MDHFRDQVFSFMLNIFIAVVIILSDVYIAVSQSLALLAYSHCVTLLSSLENKFWVRKTFI